MSPNFHQTPGQDEPVGPTSAAVAQNGGTLTSYQNNEVDGNGNNNTPFPASALN